MYVMERFIVSDKLIHIVENTKTEVKNERSRCMHINVNKLNINKIDSWTHIIRYIRSNER